MRFCVSLLSLRADQKHLLQMFSRLLLRQGNNPLRLSWNEPNGGRQEVPGAKGRMGTVV
jgi:hypothetical protein